MLLEKFSHGILLTSQYFIAIGLPFISLNNNVPQPLECSLERSILINCLKSKPLFNLNEPFVFLSYAVRGEN